MKYFWPAAILFSVLFFGTIVSAASESWKQLPPAPSVRTEVAVALVNGKVYVIGGFSPKGISDRVEAWDPASQTWETKSPLPRPLHHTTISVVSGKLYVIGGFHSGMWTPMNSTYEYDPATDSWTEKAPMPTARGALAAGVIDGKIYAVGGAFRKFFRLKNSDANEVYDPKIDRWQKRSPIPTPRDHLTVSVWNGNLYAIGGRIDVNYNKNLDNNESYDPKTNRWSTHPPLPTARSGITSQTLNGKIFVFGGESGEGTFTQNEAYDPKRKKWETMPPMLEGRHGLGSAVIKNEIHLLAGGPNPGGGGSDSHMVFRLKKNNQKSRKETQSEFRNEVLKKDH
ncbi:MAG: kelch repeat-containing protein [Nitrospinota bacterium]|nr:kelch repeat-containing protein [Nitrospinota bacterium]